MPTELIDPSRYYLCRVAHMLKDVVIYERNIDRHGNVVSEWVTDGTDVAID